ncbi:MAG: GNAT family N-acetyltransferase [Chloroflexi bacterium]|nr:GNAT family N-acetyltransferase [Chloroflexota bacterium]
MRSGENAMKSDDPAVQLRDVYKSDLPIFFEQENDEEARYMAAFVAPNPDDRAGFMAHWDKLLSNPAIIKRTILLGEAIAGQIYCFELEGQQSIGYWIGKAFWGQGVATRALLSFLEIVTHRPVYARVVKDNLASQRVLEKCGFAIVGEDVGFAHGRGADVEEYIFERRD